MHTAEPLASEPRSFKVEVGIEKLKIYKSPGTDQIPAELVPAGGNAVRYEIHKLINSIWKKKLPQQWKESIIVPTYKKGDKTDCNNYTGILLLPTVYKILLNILVSRLTQYLDEILRIISVDLDVIVQLLIRYSALFRNWRKMGV
jgi:hypothetical protein